MPKALHGFLYIHLTLISKKRQYKNLAQLQLAQGPFCNNHSTSVPALWTITLTIDFIMKVRKDEAHVQQEGFLKRRILQ
ncbi:hypothetical protein AWH48_14430 [Domibacillus aminovorans]|uniref:Uncharacterized protein n=1 Tax=Domibacillus aminovorans TaxID=29332 RepID=A0A177KJ30_9BACI|nr:hypothetical protein AWH48_14430 [Domibacillus aminovorans]